MAMAAVTARRNGWLVALPVGLLVAVIAYVVFRDRAAAGGIGPVDVLGVLSVFTATVYIALPRSNPLIQKRRASRLLSAWSILMLLLAIAEAARQCTSSVPDCRDGGEPLKVFAVWAVGFAILSIGWYLTRPRR